MYLCVGLGNPGLKYKKTRHNTGFMAIDALADDLGVSFKKSKFNAVCADTVISGEKCILAKPSTYMNNSGQAVRAICDFYKIPAENIIIIFDDISLEPGKIRIRKKGSAGGHNGMKSIISHMGTDEIMRIKVGVGEKPDPDEDLADYVLSKYSKDGIKQVESASKDIEAAIKLIITGNVDEAMNKYN